MEKFDWTYVALALILVPPGLYAFVAPFLKKKRAEKTDQHQRN